MAGTNDGVLAVGDCIGKITTYKNQIKQIFDSDENLQTGAFISGKHHYNYEYWNWIDNRRI